MERRSGNDLRWETTRCEDERERVLLVGEGEGWRGFASRLSSEAEVDCCWGTQNAACLLHSAKYRSVVFDWPPERRGPSGSDASELCRLTRGLSPEAAVIAATAPQAVAERVRALEAGVDDCVSYEIDVSEFLARTRAIERRRRSYPAGARAEEVQERARALARAYHLSARELEALQLLAQGTHLKEIAAKVGCGYSTIRTHLRRVCGKLGCSGTREAIIKLFAFDIRAGAVYPK